MILFSAAHAFCVHASWYAMFVFTVFPMALSIPRHLSLAYLVVYALSGAFFVLYGIPDLPQQHRASHAWIAMLVCAVVVSAIFSVARYTTLHK